MFGAVDCVSLLVPSEGILPHETDTGILLTVDTDTVRFDVIPGELGRSSWDLLAERGAAKLSS